MSITISGNIYLNYNNDLYYITGNNTISSLIYVSNNSNIILYNAYYSIFNYYLNSLLSISSILFTSTTNYNSCLNGMQSLNNISYPNGATVYNNIYIPQYTYSIDPVHSFDSSGVYTNYITTTSSYKTASNVSSISGVIYNDLSGLNFGLNILNNYQNLYSTSYSNYINVLNKLQLITNNMMTISNNIFINRNNLYPVNAPIYNSLNSILKDKQNQLNSLSSVINYNSNQIITISSFINNFYSNQSYINNLLSSSINTISSNIISVNNNLTYSINTNTTNINNVQTQLNNNTQILQNQINNVYTASGFIASNNILQSQINTISSQINSINNNTYQYQFLTISSNIFLINNNSYQKQLNTLSSVIYNIATNNTFNNLYASSYNDKASVAFFSFSGGSPYLYNSNYKLVLQTDGNLVIYTNSNNSVLFNTLGTNNNIASNTTNITNNTNNINSIQSQLNNFYTNNNNIIQKQLNTLSSVINIVASNNTFYNLNVTNFLSSVAGVKIVIQNGQDGGTDRGIYMYTSGDTNWVIYMSTSNGISPGNNKPCIGFNNMYLFAVRFRVFNDPSYGFIWENNNERLLMSLNGSTGDLYTKGNIYTSNSNISLNQQITNNTNFINTLSSVIYTHTINNVSGEQLLINSTGLSLFLNSYSSNINITANTGNISIAAEYGDVTFYGNQNVNFSNIGDVNISPIGDFNIYKNTYCSMSLTLPNNSNSSTNKLFLAGNDLNHCIYSTGTGGNSLYFCEYNQFIFYSTQRNANTLTIDNNGSVITSGNINCGNITCTHNITCTQGYNIYVDNIAGISTTIGYRCLHLYDVVNIFNGLLVGYASTTNRLPINTVDINGSVGATCYYNNTGTSSDTGQYFGFNGGAIMNWNKYQLILQTDRNLVLYDNTNNGHTAVWYTSTGVSDRNLKKNIKPTIKKGLDIINQLQIVDFQYLQLIEKDNLVRTGLIAQDILPIIPDAVKYFENTNYNTLSGTISGQLPGNYLIDYNKITPYVIKALQEQQNIIDSLISRINILESKIK